MVSNGKGETSGGPPLLVSLTWVQTVLWRTPWLSGTGIGKRSPKPRTPFITPK
jgi:hypothetical protein